MVRKHFFILKWQMVCKRDSFIHVLHKIAMSRWPKNKRDFLRYEWNTHLYKQMLSIIYTLLMMNLFTLPLRSAILSHDPLERCWCNPNGIVILNETFNIDLNRMGAILQT